MQQFLSLTLDRQICGHRRTSEGLQGLLSIHQLEVHTLMVILVTAVFQPSAGVDQQDLLNGWPIQLQYNHLPGKKYIHLIIPLHTQYNITVYPIL